MPYFDENQGGVVFANKVDFAGSAAQISFEHGQSGGLKMTQGLQLGLQALLLCWGKQAGRDRRTPLAQASQTLAPSAHGPLLRNISQFVDQLVVNRHFRCSVSI